LSWRRSSDCVFWRRNFHPEDDIIITEKCKREDAFQDSLALVRQEFQALLANLKRDIPFYSPLKQISTSLLERLNGTIRQHVVPLTLSKRRKKHHQNSRPSAEKPTSLTLIGFSIFTFMPKEKAALVIIKTRLLDPALGEWPSRRRTRRAVRPSSFLHLLKVTGTIYRNRGASLDMDTL